MPTLIELVAHFEGYRQYVYADSANHRTIGYGHKLTTAEQQTGTLKIGAEIVPLNRGLTHAQADRLLLQDLQATRAQVDSVVTRELFPHQWDALTSFTFNLGVGNLARSTLLRKVNAGELAQAEREFHRWVYAGGKRLNGLVKRRAAEAAMWAGKG